MVREKLVVGLVGVVLAGVVQGRGVEECVGGVGGAVGCQQRAEGLRLGDELFRGGYGGGVKRGLSERYVLGQGDMLKVRLTGRKTLSVDAEVDVNGRVWIEGVGAVEVGGVDLGGVQAVVERAVRRVYVSGVDVYVAPVDTVGAKVGVYVGGGVVRPGVYEGGIGDGVLRYLDLAGGIAAGGSYREVIWRRGGHEMGRVDCYEFLRSGGGVWLQKGLRDGDELWVAPKKGHVRVSGVRGSLEVEFLDERDLEGILRGGLWGRLGLLVGGREVSGVVWKGEGQARELFVGGAWGGVAGRVVRGGGVLEVVSDGELGSGDRVRSVVVAIEGLGVGSRVVVPVGTSLRGVMEGLVGGRQEGDRWVGGDGREWELPVVYRESVARQQKEALEGYGRQLTRMSLVGGSRVKEESELRGLEAGLVEKFVSKLEGVVPKGQVVLGDRWGEWKVGEGDRVEVGELSATVSVVGDVLRETAFSWRAGLTVGGLVRDAGVLAGGNRLRYLVVSRGGLAREVGEGELGGIEVKRGDVVYVVRAVSDEKGYEVARGVTDIVFKAAVVARTLIGVF